MAENYTEYYKLNQWAAGDAVLRADFNSDNAKTDAALHALAEQITGAQAQESADIGALRDENRLVLLNRWTTSADAVQVDLALDDQARACRRLYLMCTIQTQSPAAVMVCPNGDTEQACRICEYATGYGESMIKLVACGPEKQAWIKSEGVASDTSTGTRAYGSSIISTAKFQEMQTLRVYISTETYSWAKLLGGCQFALYGLK